MKKRLTVLLLALTFITLFSGCGEIALQTEEIVIALLDTPANISAYGAGLQLVLEQNPSVTVRDRLVKINFVRVPIHDSPADAIRGFRAAVKEYNASVVIGCSSPQLAQAASDIAEEYQVPFLSPAVGPAFQYQRFTFLTRPSLTYSAEAVTQFMLTDLKVAKLGILFDIDDSYSADCAEAVHHFYSVMGGSSVLVRPYKKDKNRIDALKEVAAYNPDLILLASSERGLYKRARELKDLGYSGALFNLFTHEAFERYENDPPVDPVTPYFIFYWSPDEMGEINALLKEEAQKADTRLSVELAMGFDTTLRLINALKTANGADSLSIQQALAGLHSMTGASGEYNFTHGQSTQTRKICWIYKVENNTLVKAATLVPSPAR